MIYFFRNIRFYVLTFSTFLSFAVYFYVIFTIPEGTVQTITLTQIYALTSITYLYFALLAGPFCYIFKRFPFRGQYLKARRAIGVSAFYFALLHSNLGFFGQLGGFAGLGLLSIKYLLAITLSFTALIILFFMAATSFDFMVEKLTFLRWKLLHRLVYAASLLILTHALIIGTHFQDLSTIIPQIFFAAFTFLFFLEALRFENFIQEKFMRFPRFGLTAIMIAGFTLVSYFYFSIIPAFMLITLIVFVLNKYQKKP